METSTHILKSIRAGFILAGFLLLTLFTPQKISAQVTVAGSTGANGVYGNLRLAFVAINANGTQAGNNITIAITAGVVDNNTAVLNQPAVSTWASLTISPSGGAFRTLSGAVPAGSPLVDLNGADNVTIDGLNTGGNALIISNTTISATAGTGTIRFIADATSNTVRNCTISGSGNGAGAGTSPIYFSTGITTGNDGNTIDACTISPAGVNLPLCAISSLGSSANLDNSGNTISNCIIKDYFNAGLDSYGIYITNSSSWSIIGNKFFQTAVRNITTATTHRAVYVITGTSGGYTINNNIIGYANANTPQTGVTSYTSGAALSNKFFPIELWAGVTPVSNIQGNTITAISFATTANEANAPGNFTGIVVSNGSANIGTTAPNIIGATTGNGSISVTSTVTGAIIGGIYANSMGTVNIKNNKIGSISSGNVAAIGYKFQGITTNSPAGVWTNIAISDNLIGSTTTTNSISVGGPAVTTGICTFVGICISSSSTTGDLTITNDTIQNCTVYSTTVASVFTGISNIGLGILTINDNYFISCKLLTTTGSGAFIGINNSGAALSKLKINRNTFRNMYKTSSAGAFTGIINTGTVSDSITITDNHLGDAVGGLITYSIANSGALNGIQNTQGGANAILTITGNDIRGITDVAAAANLHTYILNTATNTLSQNISDNNFTNLNLNTLNDVIFIQNSVALRSSGTQTINNDSIIGTFTKSGDGGTVTLLTTTGVASAPGATMYNNGNCFSNISLTGATAMAGWKNWDNGSATKTISGNTFTNWICGTGTVTVLTCKGNCSITSNTINTVAGGGVITGIDMSTSGTQSASLNTVNGLSSTGATLVTGISASTASADIFRNKIYDLSGSNLGTTINGIKFSIVSGGTLTNVYNNIIGDLRATAANTANAIIGINIPGSANTSYNVYYNTVWLNASSSGNPFGTSGVYAVGGIPTSGALNLNNNVIVNTSTPAGTGITAAYRRSSPALTNYNSTCNNNFFYAGVPGATKLLFYDGTNSESTLAGFKTRVNPRESASVSELPHFLSTTGSNADFLRIDSTFATQMESGAVNISTYTNAFDAQIRQGNPGYSGSGTAPDMGAYEFSGTANDLSAPAISFTPISKHNSCLTTLSFSATVTDGTGVNTAPGTRPRVYYKKSTNSNDITATGWKWVEATNTSNPFNFSIDLTLLSGGVALGNTIQYFVIAQDTKGTPLVGINSGTFNAAPASVALLAGAFPIGGTINSDTIKGLTGPVNVGAGQTYTTLTGAGGLFDAINKNGLAGNFTANITSNITETNIYQLNDITYGCGSAYKLTISPTGGPWTLSGAIAGTALIGFWGADNVTIDGKNNLIISNTSTASGAVTIMFAGGNNDTIKNCTIKGACADVLATSGTITFSGDASNIVITGCTITAGASTPSCAICGSGTSRNVTISNNKIQDYWLAAADTYGIYIYGNDASWTIAGNKFFQSASRNITSSKIARAIYITGGGGGFTINNNIIGYANANTPQTGTTAYTSGAASTNKFLGIDVTVGLTPVSNIQGNTITNISLATTANTGAPGNFVGIRVVGDSVNIGNNTIGARTGNGSVLFTSTVDAAFLTGIYSNSTGTVNIQNNVIGSISTGNVAAIGYKFNAINTAAASGNYTISGNLIGSTSTANSISVGGAAVTTGLCEFWGINNAAKGTLSISNDTIQNCTVYGTTAASTFTGIVNSGAAGTVVISGNRLITGTLKGTTNNGAFIGIQNTAASAPSTLTINDNTLRSLSKTASDGPFTGIINSGIVTDSISITNNHLGDGVAGLIAYSIASTGGTNPLTGISNTGGGASSVLTITGNEIKGITDIATATTAHTYILNSARTFSQNISDNNFNNLINLNTTGNITFISNNLVGVGASGTQTIDKDSIIGSFSKIGASGIVILFSANNGISAAGAALNYTDNYFSNITVAGTTTLTGLYSRDYGLSTKTITGNTFSNWTCGTGIAIGIDEIGRGTQVIQNNTMHTVSAGGVFYGIRLNSPGTSVSTISNNTIGNTTNNNMTLSGDVINCGIISQGNGILACNNNTIQEFNLTSTGTAATFYGINTVAGTNTFQNDTIREIDMATTYIPPPPLTTPSLAGIYLTSSGTGQIINKCAVKNLNQLTAAANVAVYGIYAKSSGGATISKCMVSGLKVVSNGISTVNSGIYLDSTGTFNLSNNVVMADNGGNAQSPLLNGIYVNSYGTTTVYHNTVKIYGTSTTGNQVSACLYKNSASGTLTVKNNLWQNIRENGRAPGGEAYAIDVNNTGGTNTFDYNYLETMDAPIAYWAGDNAAIGDWTTASSGTVNAGGTITVDALGYSNDAVVRNAGTNLMAFVPDDRDGNTRDATPWFGGWDDITTLPIELLNFSGYNTTNGNVLYWSTASETNNDFFTIERAPDATNFTPVAIVDGAGNSTQVLNYSAIDSFPGNGYNYYRLKQTDWNGQSKYSEIIAIYYSSNEMSVSDVYPNPTKNTVYLDYYSPIATTIQIQVTDNLGRILIERIQEIPDGDNRITTDISTLAAGVYFFKVVTEQRGYNSITRVVKD